MSAPGKADFRLDLASLAQFIRSGAVKPAEAVRLVYRRVAADANNPIWISLRPMDEALEEARRLELDQRRADAASLPLYGIPFAATDTIDVRGLPTSVGCRGLRRLAETDAPAVARLRAAGAIPIGKTNLDQFALGLTGTRSNLGVCRNAIDGEYVAGGANSGAAVAVAAGHVSFALGSGTAGAALVPAALNQIAGLKPTRGLLSLRGVAAASRSLDGLAILAVNASDAQLLMNLAAAYDESDPCSRRRRARREAAGTELRIGVLAPDQGEFYGDLDSAELYAGAVERIRQSGARTIPIDFAPLREAGALIDDGPWLAERYAAIQELLGATHDRLDLHPVTRLAIEKGARYSAIDLFAAADRMRLLARRAARNWERVDALALPTLPTVYRVRDALAEPLETDRRLGLYASFIDPLDLCALSIPAALRRNGLPFAVTLVAPPFHEDWLCALARRFAAIL